MTIEQRENNENPQEMPFKTVNQLAREYGLTKNGVMVRIKKMLDEIRSDGLPETDYITRGKRNTIYVKPKGMEWLATWNANNTPMQEPAQNIDLELYKLEQSEQKARELEEQQTELRQTIDFLQSELINKTNQINALTATVSHQANIIDSQSTKLLQLMAPQEQGAGVMETERTVETTQNAQNASETPVSVSDGEIIAELSKRPFLDKIRLLFGH